MKLLYPALLLLLSAWCLNAQLPTETSVLNSRLVATHTEKWTSGAWADQDSSNYTYSGTRGSELLNGTIEADFDTRQNWIWQTGSITNSKLFVKTYDANNRLTQEIIKVWDNGAWIDDTRETFTYGAFGTTNILFEEWDGSAWVGSYRINYTYDVLGYETVGQRDIWSGGMWVGSLKVFSTYDANNRRTVKVTQNFIANNWRNQYRDTYTYDASGRILTSNYETWNTVDNLWQPNSRWFYTYTATGQIATQLNQTYAGGNWVDNTRETRTYNGQGFVTQKLNETYASGTWQNSQRTDYTPNSMGLNTETVISSWSNAMWNETTRYRLTFDAAGNTLTFLTSYYTSGSWNDDSKVTSTYNAFNQRLTLLFEEDFGSGLENNYRTFYYYDTYEDGTSGIAAIPTLASTVLPNPFTINVAIQLQVAEAGSHTFEVYNMAGQRVHAESRNLAPGQQTIVWEGGQMPKGVYFYRIYAPNGLASGKLVKQ